MIRCPAWPRLLSVAAVLVALGCPSASAEEPPRKDPIIDTGLVERSGVSLMLLDVEVRDEQGRPLRGLRKEDFAVYLNGRRWRLVSVDDLCPCSDPGPDIASGAEEGGPAGTVLPPSTAPLPTPDGPRFVIYLDFSQLRPDGRENAVTQTRRWIRDMMQPTDEVMLAVFTDEQGLRQLTPFTRDKIQLIAALDGLVLDTPAADLFARLFADRVGACQACILPCARACGTSSQCCISCLKVCPHCLIDGREEKIHGRRALSALRRLLQRLETVPGRKTMLYFHQNQVMMLAYLYPCTEVRVGDHARLLEQLAADATRSRTIIYTVQSGDFPLGAATNLGANLADYTGGGYNRGPTDMARLIDRAGRGCACTYRLGLKPSDGGRVSRVRVEVLGRPLPHRYRVQHLTAAERWWRRAESTLTDPEAARDVPLAAAILPLAGRGRSWDLSLQIALDANFLEMLPEGRRTKGGWEVGALLVHQKSGRSWEMLGVSEIRAPDDADLARAFIVHEHSLEGLAPGTYELRAFVRDRLANLFGGARATISLPRPVPGALAGPLMRGVEAAHVRTVLPLRKKRGAPDPAARGVIHTGPLPLAGHAVPRGESVEFVTWVCPGDHKDSIYEIRRFVLLDDRPLFRFDEPLILRAGACVSLSDRLDTTPMEAGLYSYAVDWNPEPGAEPVSARIAFEVTSPTELQPGAGDAKPRGESLPNR